MFIWWSIINYICVCFKPANDPEVNEDSFYIPPNVEIVSRWRWWKDGIRKLKFCVFSYSLFFLVFKKIKLKKPKNGSIAFLYSLFVFLNDLLVSTVCLLCAVSLLSWSECMTVKNGLERLINYDTIKMCLIVHWIANW